MSKPSEPAILWKPSENFKSKSHLRKYIAWLEKELKLRFDNYDSLWEWSVKETKTFWQSIWDYFQIISHSKPEFVHSDDPMPYTRWFEGASLNYAEHIFRSKSDKHPAIIFQSETQALTKISWEELIAQTAALAGWLRQSGIKKGDRVVAFLPNIPHATVAFLAVNSIGAIWSSCSPDFGSNSVADRFQQIEPRILITVDGYRYNGKPYDKSDVVEDIIDKLPSLELVISIPYINPDRPAFLPGGILWDEVMKFPANKLEFEAVPFDHPIWVLYSSGTTGIPKAITHSHGGVLLEHYKYLAFHNDVHPGERFFWYSTTGWMMWNFVQAALLMGSTIVLYDGSPAYPDLNVLWKFSEEAEISHFGTSAPYLVACLKKEIRPSDHSDLSAMRSLSSTGAPLPPEAFDWVYSHAKKDLWLCSMSGGTDVCTAFVGGVPFEPVYRGEIQRRALGCAMYSFDEMGGAVVDEVGEMVIIKPMPSMPIYFWDDPDNSRYLSSYFEMYPGGIWRHGDWLKITSRNTLILLGRSDATLNRHGIRIGTAEIYRAVNKIVEIKDSIIVNLELEGGHHYMPLFIVLEQGEKLTESLKSIVNTTLKTEYSPRHVPDEIIEIHDVPYTISGKKLEAPVKKILLGIPVEKAANRGAMKNPESLDFFITFSKKIHDA